MPTTKETCPSCGKPEGLPVVYGDYELLPDDVRSQMDRGEVLCGGDSISVDDDGRPMNMACLACTWEWRR